MDYNINFPHLGIYFEHVGKLIDIHGFTIAYYGIVVCIGIIAGVWMALAEAKRTGQDVDMYMDFAIYEVIFCVIGARAYYVIFSWDSYKDNLLSILNLRQGGLAIYGAFIMCLIVCLVYTRVKKLDFRLLCDTGVLHWDSLLDVTETSSTERLSAVIPIRFLRCNSRFRQSDLLT